MNDEYLEIPQAVSQGEKQALARLYADEGVRSYLTHLAQVANRNMITALTSKNPDVATNYSIRFVIFTKLLESARNEFVNSEKVEKQK